MQLGPVGGIFNLAVILKDSIFENQDVDKFIECMAPKAIATKFLDEISRKLCPDLQYFVVFSSVSCGRGNAGQSNYGMANSVMERIMEQRHSLGLPAKAIQWGAVGEVGLVADMQEDKIDMEIGGTLQQRISSCLDEMDTLMTVTEPLVSSMVVAEKRYNSGKKGNILEAIMNIMSIRDVKSLSLETTLSELGMDSMMTVEIQQTLEREHNLVIPAQELRSMTLSKLLKRANNKDPLNSNAAASSNKTPTGFAMLMRNLGDETNSDKTILKLESLSCEGIKTLIIPGIEGMAGTAWYSLAHNIKGPTYVLQCRSTAFATNLQSIHDGVIDEVSSLFVDDEKFVLIGYSFGALLTLKLGKTLESQGKTGKVILIDGSPKFLKTLAIEHLPENFTHETLEIVVLANSISLIYPEDSGEVLKKVLSVSTWSKRVEKLIEISKPKNIYSDEYGVMILNALLNRIKLVVEFIEDDFPVLDSPATLIRPSEFSVHNIDEDYGISAFFSEKIDLRILEGNHMTILDNQQLYELLNDQIY